MHFLFFHFFPPPPGSVPVFFIRNGNMSRILGPSSEHLYTFEPHRFFDGLLPIVSYFFLRDASLSAGEYIPPQAFLRGSFLHNVDCSPCRCSPFLHSMESFEFLFPTRFFFPLTEMCPSLVRSSRRFNLRPSLWGDLPGIRLIFFSYHSDFVLYHWF